MRRGNRPTRWRLIVGVVCLVLAVSVPSIAMGATLAPVYRFFKPSNGTHFYTAGEAEKDNVINTMGSVYRFEGVAYTLEVDNPQMNAPLYRFFNKANGSHFYTAGEAEKNNVIANLSNVFTYEGPAYNVSLNPTGNTPVYRFYNKANGSHFYTVSEAEKNEVIAKYSATYNFEGPAFYLAYSATPPPPPPAVDTTKPTTISNANLLYRGPATVLLSATDNPGGSGVKATYYILDGFGPVQGTLAYAGGLGLHTLEFWSVDNAGNEETHNLVTFTVMSVHSSPDIAECTDCHTQDIMTTHSNNCAYCHATGVTPSFVCSDCHEPADSLETHPNLETVHDASASACTDAECHVNNVGDIHTQCASCHGPGITPTLDCVTCHVGDPHAGASHTATGQSCIAAGCHVSTDAPTLHVGKCSPCHAEGVTPSLVCADCHEDKRSLDTHPAMPTAHDATGQSCVGAGCHDADAALVHDTMLLNGLTPPSCEACHNGDPLTIVCDTCHDDYATIHPAQGAAVHTVTGFCYSSGCHVSTGANKSDVALIHASWANPPGCAACHEPGVTPKLTCFDSACHGAGGATVETVHDYTHPSAAGDLSTGCTVSACHGSEDVLDLSPGHTGCSCHTYNSPELNAIIGAGMNGAYAECLDCHVDPFDPAADHPYHVGDHDAVEAGIAGTVSSACVSCHGTNLMDVSAGSLHIADEHAGCSCHAYGEATPANNECVDCHQGGYAPHGFLDGFNHTGEGWNAASGHNTEAYGTIGAVEKFDGSQGVTLYAEAERDFDPMPATWEVEAGFQWAEAPAAWVGQTVSAGDVTVMTSDWDFPEVNVFWEPGDPDAPDDAMYLDETSVVTCEDCHTGLLLAGPHGADDNWGLDPDYPADYSYGELTKRVDAFPSGIKLRKSLNYTTQGGATPNVITAYDNGMALICSKCHDLQNYQSGTTKNNPLPMYSTGDDPFEYPAGSGVMWDPIYIDAAGTRSDGYYVWTRNDGSQVDPASITISGAVGSQTWSSTDTEAQAWIQGAAGTFTSGTIGSSNTAHSSHHQDTNDGSAQCVGCHIGVPHGWKRPRLLVNSGWNGMPNSIGAGVIEGDRPPYKDPDLLGTTRTNGGVLLNPLTGYNGMGMLTLSAVDNHNLWAGSGSATDPAKQYFTGAAYWSEPSCQACNDHAGEDGVRIIEPEATTYGP